MSVKQFITAASSVGITGGEYAFFFLGRRRVTVKSRGRSVGLATTQRGSSHVRGRRFFCFPKLAGRLWGPPTFLFSSYLCYGGKAAGGVKLTTYLQLLLLSPLYAFMAWTGKTVPLAFRVALRVWTICGKDFAFRSCILGGLS